MSEEYECEECGKQYKSRSGLYKHKLKCSPLPDIEEDESEFMEEGVDPTDDTPSTFDDEWLDFSFDSDDSNATVRLPPVLKAVSNRERKPPKKMTKAEQKAQSQTNIAILKMGLTGIDHLITRYGKAVLISDTYECVHSDADKTLVARAQWEYLKESGLDLSTYLSTGGVALAMTGWYIVPEVYSINKNRKKSLLGNTGRVAGSLLSKIPLIGRFFKKKEDDPSPLDSEGQQYES